MTDIINTFVFPIVRREYILDALKSLHYFTPANYQTIVIDQTRPDAEFEAQVRALCDVHVKTKKNYGFAQGTNIGWRLAQQKDQDYIFEVMNKCEVTAQPGPRLQPTEYLTTCNDDVVFIWNKWWHGIVESFKRYDTAVCVNPMSPREPGWGYGEPGFREHLTFRESIDPENILKLVNGYRRIPGVEEEDYSHRKGQHVDGLTCWCSVFRASAVDELGMFDERFWPGAGEDYDYMGRIYLAGKRALASSLSWVWHWWGQSKDEPGGLNTAQPAARAQWNRLDILWPKGFDVWGRDPETGEPLTRLPDVAIMPL
jgi:GT2 family glycosyltransferase